MLYAIGYHFGHSLVYPASAVRPLLHAEREAKIEQMIRKHEVKVLFLSRFMVGVRAPVYLAAGILRIPFLRFLLIDAVCATAVVGLFFGLSYAYGERLTRLIRQSEIGLTVVIAVAVVAVLGVWFWKRRRRKPAAIADAEPAGEETCTSARTKPRACKHARCAPSDLECKAPAGVVAERHPMRRLLAHLDNLRTVERVILRGRRSPHKRPLFRSSPAKSIGRLRWLQYKMVAGRVRGHEPLSRGHEHLVRPPVIGGRLREHLATVDSQGPGQRPLRADRRRPRAFDRADRDRRSFDSPHARSTRVAMEFANTPESRCRLGIKRTKTHR